MAKVTEDRLVDCVLNEIFTAVGCVTFAAVPGAWFAYTHNLSGAIGALLAGLLTYAIFTAVDHFGRTKRATALQAQIADLEDRLALADALVTARGGQAEPSVIRLPAPSWSSAARTPQPVERTLSFELAPARRV